MDPLSGTGIAPAEETVETLLDQEVSGRPPLVTVTISLFNYEKHVPACLDSVAAQTLGPIEILVVDDCSTDASPRVVTHWLEENGPRFTRYRLLHHRRNQGLAHARNTAFAHAAAPLVFVLDADNILYPPCLDRLYAALQTSEASFAYCYAEAFGEKTGLINLKPWNPNSFSENNHIDAMVLLRKSVWEQVGGYSTDMPVMGWEDFDLWFKIARAKGWGIQVPEILTRYRVHATSMLNAITNHNGDLLWAHLRTKYPELFPEVPTPFFDYQRCAA